MVRDWVLLVCMCCPASTRAARPRDACRGLRAVGVVPAPRHPPARRPTAHCGAARRRAHHTRGAARPPRREGDSADGDAHGRRWRLGACERAVREAAQLRRRRAPLLLVGWVVVRMRVGRRLLLQVVLRVGL